jgi:hypothetical protein
MEQQEITAPRTEYTNTTALATRNHLVKNENQIVFFCYTSDQQQKPNSFFLNTSDQQQNQIVSFFNTQVISNKNNSCWPMRSHVTQWFCC